MDTAIGIDFGTTYSVAAYPCETGPRVIPGPGGSALMPSVYARLDSGRGLVGAGARDQAWRTPQQSVFSIKRKMGTGFRTRLGGRPYAPQEIAGFILQTVKRNAETYLGTPVEKAVITVPAYFNHQAREATKAAGEIAGLEVLRIISEPTAAALAYGFNRESVQKILVWDLGGGTFDVSVLALDNGFFKVIAVNGDNRLGGDDFDRRLMDHAADLILQDGSTDIREFPVLTRHLRTVCEQVKKELSGRDETLLTLKPVPAETKDFRGFECRVTARMFEAMTKDLVTRMIPPTETALRDASLPKNRIDRILLVGGATRMPAIRKLACRFFNQAPYLDLNPDQVVAMGAAIQAGVLTGSIKDIILVDVIPLSLGLASQGGIFTRLIEKNTTIPTASSRIFTTAADLQTSMNFDILQGERKMAGDNLVIGNFELEDIRPLARGQARVEVEFKVDANGICHVTAQDLETENETGIRIDAVHRLSDLEVARAKKEARDFAETDHETSSRVKTLIQAENRIADMENLLRHHGDALSPAMVLELETARDALRAAVDSEDLPLVSRLIREIRNTPLASAGTP